MRRRALILAVVAAPATAQSVAFDLRVALGDTPPLAFKASLDAGESRRMEVSPSLTLNIGVHKAPNGDARFSNVELLDTSSGKPFVLAQTSRRAKPQQRFQFTVCDGRAIEQKIDGYPGCVVR